MSEYHLEAAIAAVHSTAELPEKTDWRTIVELYDRLLEMKPSPVVALNRAIAVGQWKGSELGLEEIRKIRDGDRLVGYVFYWAAIAELELQLGRPEAGREHLARAIGLARNELERRFLKRRAEDCAGGERGTN